MASRASPCRAGAGGQHVKGIPSATAAGAGGDPGASRASLPPRRAGAGVVIRRVRGVPSTTAAGAGGGGDRRGVPAYGGIVYRQRSILERSFIDQ